MLTSFDHMYVEREEEKTFSAHTAQNSNQFSMDSNKSKSYCLNVVYQFRFKR